MGVAIHNKNGQGLLQANKDNKVFGKKESQSTIKMDKGYYFVWLYKQEAHNLVAIHNKNGQGLLLKGGFCFNHNNIVAIHNKNGQGLLLLCAIYNNT